MLLAQACKKPLTYLLCNALNESPRSQSIFVVPFLYLFGSPLNLRDLVLKFYEVEEGMYI